jgi:hypothetical protein
MLTVCCRGCIFYVSERSAVQVRLQIRLDHHGFHSYPDNQGVSKAWLHGENVNTETKPYRLPTRAGESESHKINIRGLESQFVVFSNLLVCPFVSFLDGEVRVEEDGEEQVVTFPRYLHEDLSPVSFHTAQ